MVFKAAFPLALVAFLAAFTTVHGQDITRILAEHPDLSVFNHYLTVTHLVEEINRRQDITVCTVNNSAMYALLSTHPSVYTIKRILSLHILLLHVNLKRIDATILAPTMYPGASGFVNITHLQGNKATFTSTVNIGNLTIATFVKSVGASGDNKLSIIEISQVLTMPFKSETPDIGVPSELNVSRIMSAHGCKAFADTLQGTDSEVTYLRQIDGGLTVFCPTDDAFNEFIPTYKSLSNQGRTDLLNFHGIPVYQSFSMLKLYNDSARSTLASFMGLPKRFYFTVQSDEEQISLNTGVVTANVSGTITDKQPLAIYTINQVLLPAELFKANLGPALHKVQNEVAEDVDACRLYRCMGSVSPGGNDSGIHS